MTRASTGMLREVPPDYVTHYVVDASVALKWIWSEENSPRARRYLHGALEGTMQLSVPGLFWYELANAVRYGFLRPLDGESAASPWELFAGVPIHTIDFTLDALPHICELAARQEITAYDAAYVLLAQMLQVPMITSDAKLAERCSNLPFVWHLDSIMPG